MLWTTSLTSPLPPPTSAPAARFILFAPLPPPFQLFPEKLSNLCDVAADVALGLPVVPARVVTI
jgi:hypothetical protein